MVAGGADVIFTANGPLSNITHPVGTANVTVGLAGTYYVCFVVTFTVGIGAAFAIAINGVVDGSTNTNVLIASGQLVVQVELVLAAGDVVTLRNNSATPVTLDAAPGVGAQLVLNKLD